MNLQIGWWEGWRQLSWVGDNADERTLKLADLLEDLEEASSWADFIPEFLRLLREDEGWWALLDEEKRALLDELIESAPTPPFTPPISAYQLGGVLVTNKQIPGFEALYDRRWTSVPCAFELAWYERPANSTPAMLFPLLPSGPRWLLEALQVLDKHTQDAWGQWRPDTPAYPILRCVNFGDYTVAHQWDMLKAISGDLRVPSLGLTLRLLAEATARPDINLKDHPFTGVFATGIADGEAIRYVRDAPSKARLLAAPRFERARFLVPKAIDGGSCCFTEVDKAAQEGRLPAEVMERVEPVSALYQAREALGWPLPVERYLKAAEAKYRRAYDVITREEDLHPDAEAWIPLNLIVGDQLTHDWGLVLKDNAVSFLLADAGAGKTTLSRLLAAQIARRGLEERLPAPRLPLMIDASELEAALNRGERLEHALYQSAGQLAELYIPQEAFLRQLILFVDQWDRAHPDNASKLRIKLDGLVTRYGSTTLIASRPHSGQYNREQDRQVSLLGPSTTERACILKHLGPQLKEELEARFESSPRLDHALRTPMFLRWLIVYAQRERSLPTNRLEIVEGILERALDLGLSVVENKAGVDGDDLLPLIQQIAWDLQLSGVDTLSKQALSRALRGFQDLGEASLRTALQRGGVIVQLAPKVYAFAHPAFAECAAASHALKLSAAGGGLTALLQPHFADLRWSEVIINAALAVPESQEAILDGLLAEAPQQPALLGACLQIGAEGSLKVERREDLVERVWGRFEEHFHHAVPPEAWRPFYLLLEQQTLTQRVQLGWPPKGAVNATQRTEAAKETPQVLRELAIGLGTLGSALRSAGHPAAAVEVHREEVELLRALASLWEGASSSHREAAAKDRPATVRELAIGLYNLGSVLGATKDREDGCASVLEALELYEALAALQPHLQRERDMVIRLAQRLGCLA